MLEVSVCAKSAPDLITVVPAYWLSDFGLQVGDYKNSWLQESATPSRQLPVGNSQSATLSRQLSGVAISVTLESTPSFESNLSIVFNTRSCK